MSNQPSSTPFDAHENSSDLTELRGKYTQISNLLKEMNALCLRQMQDIANLTENIEERDQLRAELAEARELLQSMLNVAENCDETGYADGYGFVDVDALHEKVRAAAKGGAK